MSNHWNIPNTKVDKSMFKSYNDPIDLSSNRVQTIKHSHTIKDEVLKDLKERFEKQEEKIEDQFKVLDEFMHNYYKDYVLIHRKLQEAIDLLEKIKKYKV